MECIFRISFTLKFSPSLQASFDSVNNVSPNQAIGSHISRKSGNSKRLSLFVSHMKKSIPFTVLDEDEQKIGEQIQLYNLACSLQKCSILHVLNDTGILEISILTNMEDADYISSYYKKLKNKE